MVNAHNAPRNRRAMLESLIPMGQLECGGVCVDESFDWDSLTFSLTPTETMYITTTEGNEPWMPGKLQPYGDIPMSPAAGVLNYGQGLFEGMKAFRTSKNRIVFFRPEENARRMQRGADRLKMPPVPESIFVDAVEQVVAANNHWVPPTGKGCDVCAPIAHGKRSRPRRFPRTLLHLFDLRHAGRTVLQGRNERHRFADFRTPPSCCTRRLRRGQGDRKLCTE